MNRIGLCQHGVLRFFQCNLPNQRIVCATAKGSLRGRIDNFLGRVRPGRMAHRTFLFLFFFLST